MKASHNTGSLDEFRETLAAFAVRVGAIRKAVAASSDDSWKFEFEQRRARGLEDLTKWIDEAEITVESAAARARKSAGK